MKKKFAQFPALLLLGISMPLLSGVELMSQSQTSWDGGKFSYPEGKPEITAVKLSLVEGKDTPFHCHPVPTMGYISKGKVLLETQQGKNTQVQQGDSVIEVMKTVHRGKALEGDAEIIVFYAGAKEIPVTVLESNQKDFKKYCL